jgi:hypothetical protein
MPWTSIHLGWLINTGEKLITIDGKHVEVWEFRHENDDEVLSAWAKHYRNHYCQDCDIDQLRKGYGCSRSDYLNTIKFPDAKAAPGPSIRAGDFGEILVADYLQYLLGYWVPRTRYSDKTIRNESTKGCDILGFKFIEKDGEESEEDTLAVFEAKTQFSGSKPKTRLQDAINDSIKDQTRKAESLNAIKQRLFALQKPEDAELIERFQNPEDRPYKEVSGAVALFARRLFNKDSISKTNADKHPNHNGLVLLVIHGKDMMKLVHELYRRAADEA